MICLETDSEEDVLLCLALLWCYNICTVASGLFVDENVIFVQFNHFILFVLINISQRTFHKSIHKLISVKKKKIKPTK